MASDDLENWVGRIRQRRFADLSEAVWELLHLAAQHHRLVMKPRAGVGLEFTVNGEKPRVYPLADMVGWLRAILARLATLLKNQGVTMERTGLHGFTTRIKMPDGSGADHSFHIEMKNNQQGDAYLVVCRHAAADNHPLLPGMDSPEPAAAE